MYTRRDLERAERAIDKAELGLTDARAKMAGGVCVIQSQKLVQFWTNELAEAVKRRDEIHQVLSGPVYDLD